MGQLQMNVFCLLVSFGVGGDKMCDERKKTKIPVLFQIWAPEP